MKYIEISEKLGYDYHTTILVFRFIIQLYIDCVTVDTDNYFVFTTILVFVEKSLNSFYRD